jgi:hypothetical protein
MMPVLDFRTERVGGHARFPAMAREIDSLVPAMAREIDSLADELRADGARVKSAASAAVDVRGKNRLERMAEVQAKAIDIERFVGTV